jgi:L-lactate dehydrogenase complex protein LldF
MAFWHGEVLRVTHDNWPQKLREICAAKGVRSLLYGEASAHAEALKAAGIAGLKPYDRPVGEWKKELFDDTDAGLTSTRGGIAETGTLIIWPDANEPRLMSLVPPIHFALLDADQLHDTLFDAMSAQRWSEGMPTNALLVSGPSKTADIQVTLAYGAHGPKELVVLLLDNEVNAVNEVNDGGRAMNNSQQLNFVPASEFKQRASVAVADAHLRKSFRGAMDFLISKRAAQFPNPEALERQRSLAEHIRKYSLARLPELLEQLERKLTDNGVQVHWAEDGEEACAIIVGIAQRHSTKLMVKGKSMVSEEVELNHAMAAAGIDALESDMGEYIVQLDGEKPSHIIMPAIHKTKQQIARLFADKVPGAGYTESVDELIGIGRAVLREKFMTPRSACPGVNFAVAETGTLCLVENEGNGRMCTTVPEVHIAITGIEKVVEKLEHVPPLFGLLTRSATGQAITTYFNMISGPRKPGEKDGPGEMHLVLVDNGRTQAYGDEQLRSTLQCIRCGACMNHCPVYTRIGGHAYGTTYPGPIGEIISPHMLGLNATHVLPTASSLCGACGEVCPVRIPIPDLLVRLREEAQHDARPGHAPLRGQGAAKSRLVDAIWSGWAALYTRPALYRAFGWLATRFRALTPPMQGGWTVSRTPMKPAARTLHELMAVRRSPLRLRLGQRRRAI